MKWSGVTRRLAAAVILLWPLAAAAESLTVTAPVDGEVLRGGSLARIAWTAAAPLPRGVVEWEAFLSVDGGRYYATRITPHLDIDIRSFEWRVPNVSSGDVRLLIRMGDEREETSVDVPLRFSIVADPLVRKPAVRVASHRGESARPGDPGVASWASGDRDGRQVLEERAPVETSWRTSARRASRTDRSLVKARVVAAARRRPALASRTSVPAGIRGSSPLLARDILVLVRRRNI